MLLVVLASARAPPFGLARFRRLPSPPRWVSQRCQLADRPMSSVVLSPSARFSIDPADLDERSSNGASNSSSHTGSLRTTGSHGLAGSNDDLSAITPTGRGAMYLSTKDDDANINQRNGDYRSVAHGDELPLNVASIISDDGDHSTQAPPKHMYGSLVAYCFTVNYILVSRR